MNQNERILFQSCKIGDLARIKQLVEKEDTQLNIRDKWDSTPLYYSCLCGHLEVVKYLLENGAKCEANTFDGERCQYGALTDQIRNVLRNFKVVTTKLDQYELFLERLFELGAHADIAFELKGRVFRLHKFILAARSEYFRLKFESSWKHRTWIVGSHEELIPDAFESIVRYIYTDRFTSHKMYFKSCLRLAKMFKLHNLLEQFNKKLYVLNLNESPEVSQVAQVAADTTETSNEIKLNQFNIDEKLNEGQVTINDTDIFLIGKFGVNSKLSQTITIDSSDLSDSNGAIVSSKISNDFRQLAYACLPDELKKDISIQQTDDANFSSIVNLTHDLCLTLENDQKFNVHKAFIAERCDYFKTFLHDPFHEIESTNETIRSDSENEKASRKSTAKVVSQLHLKEINSEVLIEIIFFIYSNNFSKDKLDENILYEVLQVADLYLLPSLKRKCASELITHHLNSENLFDLFKLSRVYDLKKLEFACISYLASNLDKFESSEQLKELIIEDAKNLKQRQETDTIEIIDDLRYAINEITSTSSSFSASLGSFDRLIEREKKLNLIDKVLRELNLEC